MDPPRALPLGCISALIASDPSYTEAGQSLITAKQAAGEYAPHNANALIAGRRETKMLHYAVVFFIIAIVAAILGFGGIAAGAAGIAKVLFFVFLILAVITFLRRA